MDFILSQYLDSGLLSQVTASIPTCFAIGALLAVLGWLVSYVTFALFRLIKG